MKAINLAIVLMAVAIPSAALDDEERIHAHVAKYFTKNVPTPTERKMQLLEAFKNLFSSPPKKGGLINYNLPSRVQESQHHAKSAGNLIGNNEERVVGARRFHRGRSISLQDEGGEDDSEEEDDFQLLNGVYDRGNFTFINYCDEESNVISGFGMGYLTNECLPCKHSFGSSNTDDHSCIITIGSSKAYFKVYNESNCPFDEETVSTVEMPLNTCSNGMRASYLPNSKAYSQTPRSTFTHAFFNNTNCTVPYAYMTVTLNRGCVNDGENRSHRISPGCKWISSYSKTNCEGEVDEMMYLQDFEGKCATRDNNDGYSFQPENYTVAYSDTMETVFCNIAGGSPTICMGESCPKFSRPMDSVSLSECKPGDSEKSLHLQGMVAELVEENGTYYGNMVKSILLPDEVGAGDKLKVVIKLFDSSRREDKKMWSSAIFNVSQAHVNERMITIQSYSEALEGTKTTFDFLRVKLKRENPWQQGVRPFVRETCVKFDMNGSDDNTETD